jgi:hypothetical protein
VPSTRGCANEDNRLNCGLVKPFGFDPGAGEVEDGRDEEGEREGRRAGLGVGSRSRSESESSGFPCSSCWDSLIVALQLLAKRVVVERRPCQHHYGNLRKYVIPVSAMTKLD